VSALELIIKLIVSLFYMEWTVICVLVNDRYTVRSP